MIDTIRRKVLFGFLGALGVAKAQQRVDVAPANPSVGQRAVWLDSPGKILRCKDEYGISCLPRQWTHGKALNGECPVCGTVRAVAYECPDAPLIPREPLKGCKPTRTTKPTLERCLTCNAAYWMDR